MKYQVLESLTTCEMEVLALMAKGLTNREIAYELMISGRTAENHVHHIIEKLGVSNRTEAAIRAVLSGLILVRIDEITHD